MPVDVQVVSSLQVSVDVVQACTPTPTLTSQQSSWLTGNYVITGATSAGTVTSEPSVVQEHYHTLRHIKTVTIL